MKRYCGITVKGKEKKKEKNKEEKNKEEKNKEEKNKEEKKIQRRITPHSQNCYCHAPCKKAARNRANRQAG